MPEEAPRPLRVALVAPPWYPVPPDGYGGKEAMIACLADGLVERGHQVTLIGAGGHGTRAAFLPTYPAAPSERVGEVMPELVQAAMAAAYLRDLEVDVVHDHAIAGPLAAAGRAAPTLVTAHGAIAGDFRTYLAHLGAVAALAAISDAQRASAPELPWAGVVPNAVEASAFPYQERKERYCLFLGRVDEVKAPDLAVVAARAAGVPIVLAGRCTGKRERAYFERRVRPLLGPDAVWVGEAGTEEKKDLLARARCLVFPVQWEEPFGLVMVEAMACGTPVVGLRRGAVPEIVEHGVTGFVCDHPGELPGAIARAAGLDPAAARRRVLQRYDLPVMVKGYERLYRDLVARAGESGRGVAAARARRAVPREERAGPQGGGPEDRARKERPAACAS